MTEKILVIFVENFSIVEWHSPLAMVAAVTFPDEHMATRLAHAILIFNATIVIAAIRSLRVEYSQLQLEKLNKLAKINI